MASNSRLYTFLNDKSVNPTKLEVELSNILNFWNNHEQGIQQHTVLWTGQFWPHVVLKTDTGSYTVTTTETVIVINKGTGASTTVTLPASPNTDRMLIIKDGKGDAGSNNITISGNGKNIDGSSTLVISTNYGKAGIVYNGTAWNQII